MQPLFRWVGGKRRIAAKIAAEIEALHPDLYAEPFVGAGAVMLQLPSALSKLANDANPTLINVWRRIQLEAEALGEKLETLRGEYANTSAAYLWVREELNRQLRTQEHDLHEAALALYVLAHCFNGLWRTNQAGLFNVPFGRVKSPRLPSQIDLMACQALIPKVTFSCLDFRQALAEVAETLDKASGRKRFAIYVDPPYDETFDGYVAGRFDDEDQRDLAAWLRFLSARGARIWASNSDTPRIRELYAWARIEVVGERHSVGATADRRRTKGCLLIRS